MKHKTLAVVVAGAALASPASSLAQAPSQPEARVTNVGQTPQPFAPSQPDAVLTARGTCDHALTAEEAGGSGSSCPAANWPALSGDWGATLPVAGGDVLKLAIPGSPTSVGASVIDLSPQPDPNITPPPPADPPATSPRSRTADQAAPPTLSAPALTQGDDGLWQLALPAAPRSGFGPFDLAVAARTPTGDQTYTARLTAGRKADPTRCGVLFFFPGYAQSDCPVAPPGGGGVVPPGVPNGPVTPAPTPTISTPVQPAPVASTVTLKSAASRIGSIRFTTGVTKPGTFQVVAKGAGITIKRSVTINKAGSITFTLKTTKAQTRRLRRALSKAPFKLKATITGNGASATASATVRL